MSKELVKLKPEQHPITLLPKFTTDLPFFYLTMRKDALRQNINFEDTDTAGRPIRWKVTPNRNIDIGVPGVEAHEIWVKLVKPAFDETGNRVRGEPSNVIPLGSVRECLRILGWTIGGFQGKRLMQCVRQIGGAWCAVDFWMPTIEKNEEGKTIFRRIKGEFSRMTLYAVGSKHVTDADIDSGKVDFDFDLEDTIYIHLHPIEIEIQRNQPQRPIDNEYLFSVSPAARRWYELLAPAIFGVTNNTGPGYCEILYSWYVERHHTLTGQTERRRVVEQMNELIKDHIASGYIKQVNYTEIKDSRQGSDFRIRYYPGAAAKESTIRIRSRIGKKNPEQLENSPPTKPTRTAAQKETPASVISVPALTDKHHDLFNRLVDHGVHMDAAKKLATTEPEEVKRQLEYLPYRAVKKNKGGLLRKAIIEHWTAPDEYLEVKKRQLEKQASQERLERRKAEETAAEEQKTQDEALKRAYFDFLKVRLGEAEKAQPEALQSFKNDESEKRAALENGAAHKGAAKKIHLRLFDDELSHLERFRDFFSESSFEEWKMRHRRSD